MHNWLKSVIQQVICLLELGIGVIVSGARSRHQVLFLSLPFELLALLFPGPLALRVGYIHGLHDVRPKPKTNLIYSVPVLRHSRRILNRRFQHIKRVLDHI